jgi:uncharacterized protein
VATPKLHISKDLSLPVDAVTSTLIIYGGKGMGKTNSASVLVEEFAAADLRFAVIDPMGVWWGLRHDADGKGNGIEALILGGIHGDLPIEPTAGALVADLVVDEAVSVIIDISRRPDGSMWSISERVRFVTAYAKRLYQRQGEKRRPIMQVIDEAARFAPQMVRQGESEVAACMGAIAVLVEEGRNVGIGVTLVTQRSARLNKDVAELADCMIAFRIVGPNSMRAVLDWLGEHVDKARLKDIGEKLRSLPRGSALVVSPGWLEYEGIVAIRKRQTFDSSKTPEPGKQVRASGAGAKPDLGKYRERLAEVVERAKADDPKALRARVAELEKQVAKKGAAVPNKIVDHIVEKPAINRAAVISLQRTLNAGDRAVAKAKTMSDKAAETLNKAAELMASSGLRFEAELGKLRAVLERLEKNQSSGNRPVRTGGTAAAKATLRVPDGRPALTRQDRPQASTSRRNGDAAMLPPGEAATLRALIQFANGLQRAQLRVLTQYKRSSSDAYVARLRERGFVETSGDRVTATDAGVAAMPDAEPLPTGRALQDHWLRELPGGEREVLQFLIEKDGAEVAREDIDKATGYQRSSRDAYIARLKARELVVPLSRGMVKASPNLFEVM